MAMSASSMGAKIKAAVDAVGGVQTFTGAGSDAYTLALYTAIAKGVIEEIVASSELVPISTDQGTAGAGIITGSVK